MGNKKILKKDIKLDILYHDIWQAREASRVLSTAHRIRSGVPKVLYLPQMTLKALECELEMKYISLLLKGFTKKIHNLKELFEELPNDLKNECIRICNSKKEFDKYLDEYKDTFVDFRYDKNFKGIGSFEPWFLRELSNILDKYLDSISKQKNK